MEMIPLSAGTAPTFLAAWVPGFQDAPCSLPPPRDRFGDKKRHPPTMLVPLQKDGMKGLGQDFQWKLPGR